MKEIPAPSTSVFLPTLPTEASRPLECKATARSTHETRPLAQRLLRAPLDCRLAQGCHVAVARQSRGARRPATPGALRQRGHRPALGAAPLAPGSHPASPRALLAQ